MTEKRGAKPLARGGGAISFRDVDFAYEDSGPILTDFNLEIGAGQKVALVGPSGAGKSTVLNLILRFFDPQRGAILIDGQDLRDVTLASVRGASALLTQDPVLFDDTVVANIAYGSEGASEEDVIAAAAEAAAAHDFIMPAAATATARWWARREIASPAASASASPLPAPCCATRRSCCSTSRPARSTPNWRPRCRRRWSGCSSGAPSS